MKSDGLRLSLWNQPSRLSLHNRYDAAVADDDDDNDNGKDNKDDNNYKMLTTSFKTEKLIHLLKT